MNDKTNSKTKGQYSRGKGRPNGRSKPKEVEETKDRAGAKAGRSTFKRSAANDPAWYTVNGQLLKDVSSFSWNMRLGELFTLRTSATELSDYTTSVPGIMAIYNIPSIGISENNTSPVSEAMKNIYSFVRHANSGHSNYDPADLMLYLLAMDNIYTYWGYLTRALGVANVYSQTNRYMGDCLIRAMGIDPVDLRKHFADFRAYINMYAVGAMDHAVPNTMSYFLRHNWMYSNIYKDENVDRAQMYMYVPAGLYAYAIDSETGAGMLQYKELALNIAANSTTKPARQVLTVDMLMNYGNELLNAVKSQEDTGIMSGDIIKAYGENLWRLPQISEDWGVLPIYSEEVLAQIHNTEFVGAYPCAKVKGTSEEGYATNKAGLDIKQDTTVGGGYLKFAPTFLHADNVTYDKVLDLWVQDVSPELAMVASRNMVAGTEIFRMQGASPIPVVKLTSVGSEICLCAYVFTYLSDGTYYGQDFWTTDHDLPPTLWYSNYTRFNEPPIRLLINSTHTGVAAWYGEMANYTILSNQNVYNMNATALMSLFGVPYIK